MTDTPDEPDFRQVDDAMAGEEKPRLTEEEKKQNHIASGGSPNIAVYSLIDALIYPSNCTMGNSTDKSW